MVWVSNRCAYSIHVSLTNKTGGSEKSYAIAPPAVKMECYGQNHWNRSGQEKLAILRDGGKAQSFEVGPSDFILVYPDAVAVTHANVLAA